MFTAVFTDSDYERELYHPVRTKTYCNEVDYSADGNDFCIHVDAKLTEHLNAFDGAVEDEELEYFESSWTVYDYEEDCGIEYIPTKAEEEQFRKWFFKNISERDWRY